MKWQKRATLVAMVLFLMRVAAAQEPDSNTPANKAGLQPFGAYSGEGPERVNLANGNLTVTIPLVNLPGRAGLDFSLFASYNSKLWQEVPRSSALGDSFPFAVPISEYYKFSQEANPYMRLGWIVRSTPGEYRVGGRQEHLWNNATYTRFVKSITTADGGRHEAHNAKSDYFLTYRTDCAANCNLPGCNLDLCSIAPNDVYRTFDGSFFSYSEGARRVNAPDGSSGFARTDNNGFPLYNSVEGTDAHGNRITRRDGGVVDAAGQLRVSIVTDTAGREVHIRHRNHSIQPDMDYVDKIDVNPGYAGSRTIILRYQILHVWAGQLDSLSTNSGSHGDYVVLQSITLPNGRSYQFEYDQQPHSSLDYFQRLNPGHPATSSWAQLAKITYPTGGYTRYEYYYRPLPLGHNDDVNPMVAKRFVCEGPGLEEKMYQYQYYNATTTVIRPDGTREIHTFDEDGYPTSMEIYEGANRLLRTEKYYLWENNAGPGLPPAGGIPPRHNVRLSYERGILPNGLVSQTNYVYDTAGYQVGNVRHTTGNVVQKAEYAYGKGSPGGLMRFTVRGFLHEADARYGISGVHILNRPLWEQVYDANLMLRAWTGHEYDAAGYLLDRPGARQHDDVAFGPARTLRGNRVRTYRYRINNGVPADAITDNLTWYDTVGNAVAVQDALGRQTQLSYVDNFADSVNRNSYAYPTRSTPPAAQPGATPEAASRRYYFETGLPEREIDPRGAATIYQYDIMNRPTLVTQPDGGTIQTFYDDVARTVDIYRQVDAAQKVRSQQLFDGLGRLVLTRSFNSVEGNTIIEQQYDALGRLRKVSNPRIESSGAAALWTTTSYDALNRVVSVQAPDGTATQVQYNSHQTVAIDEAGKKRVTEQDAAGRLVSVWEDPQGKNYQTSYSYDVLNNLITVNQGGQLRTFEYDSLSRLTAETHPEAGPAGAGGTTRYTYYDNGLLWQRTDPRGAITTHAYDNLNRLVSKTYSGITTSSVSLSYGLTPADGYQFGRLKSSTSGGTTYSFTYDLMGRLLQKTINFAMVPDGTFRVGYRYNLAGQVTETQYPSGRTVRQAWDSSGKLRALSADQAPAGYYMNSMRYAAHGALASAAYGNQLTLAASYNTRLQLAGLAVPGRMSLEFGYDRFEPNNGNVQRIYDAITGREYLYQYDGLNRILRASGSGHAGVQDYSYDRWGNLVKTVVGEPQMGTYFQQGKNRRVAAGLTYDMAGNQLTDGQHQYTFDAESRIAAVDGSVAVYDYDAEGKRVRRTTGGVTTYYIYGMDGEVLSEFTVDRGLAASQLQAPQSDPGVHYQHADHLGTPRVITDQSGAVVSRHDYYPFGEEITAGAFGDGEARKFTGKERDVESSLDYFGARYYTSSQGRFTSLDPSMRSADPTNPQSWNRYTYVLNNPLRKIDPDGRYEKDVHYDLTRFLALAAGFDTVTATAIASANQDIDDNPTTSPTSVGNSNALNLFHFTTPERREQLWNQFQQSPSPQTIGAYLHAVQDSFSHEGLTPTTHVLKGFAPDKTYRNPEKADRMAEATYNKLIESSAYLKHKKGASAPAFSWEEIRAIFQRFNKAKSDMEKRRILAEINNMRQGEALR